MKGHLYRPITQLPPSLFLSLSTGHITHVSFFIIFFFYLNFVMTQSLVAMWNKRLYSEQTGGFCDWHIGDIYSLSSLYYLEKIWQLISLQLNFLLKSFQSQVTHWQSPYMHAYFPALNSFPSLLGDMLADAIGCLGFTWVITSLNFWLLFNTTCCQFLI